MNLAERQFSTTPGNCLKSQTIKKRSTDHHKATMLHHNFLFQISLFADLILFDGSFIAHDSCSHIFGSVAKMSQNPAREVQ